MGKETGFMEYKRVTTPYRPVVERINDFKDVCADYLSSGEVRIQAARCMDCGVPFCHSNKGCSLSNLIPEWNHLVYLGNDKEALYKLLETDDFPEFTGKICPALCEGSCVLGINEAPVAIREIEWYIINNGYAKGWIVPQPPAIRTGKKVAVVGSGPAGLVVAKRLNTEGHHVVVFEKNDKPGGLLRYGIPDFKLEKWIIDRRIQILIQEGIQFITNTEIGVNYSAEKLLKEYDAICLTGGSNYPRDLPIPGRELEGIHHAMEFLQTQNQMVSSESIDETKRITAKDKHVVVLGGGDTGSDCIGTSIRQGAKSVRQLEILPCPPLTRSSVNLWPSWPIILRTSSSHEEGCERYWSIMTTHFSGNNGHVENIHAIKVEMNPSDSMGGQPFKKIDGSEFKIEAQLVLLAMGFVHPIHKGMIEELNVQLNARGNVAVDKNHMTSIKGIFCAGDMQSGSSLVLRAMADGKKTAVSINNFLKNS